MIHKLIYNGKNDFNTISMRDVDAIKELVACDWWHPQGYKKINKYGKMVIKMGKKEMDQKRKKLCTWNPLCECNSNSPAEWSRHRVSTHHRHYASGTVPNGKEKITVKRIKMTRGNVSLCRRIYGRALYHCLHCTQ